MLVDKCGDSVYFVDSVEFQSKKPIDRRGRRLYYEHVKVRLNFIR